MLVPGAANSPADVSKFFRHFGSLMVRQDRGFDPNLVDLVSCRLLRNDRDEFSVSFQKPRSFPRFYTRWEDRKSRILIGPLVDFTT